MGRDHRFPSPILQIRCALAGPSPGLERGAPPRRLDVDTLVRITAGPRCSVSPSGQLRVRSPEPCTHPPDVEMGSRAAMEVEQKGVGDVEILHSSKSLIGEWKALETENAVV